jgi:hypothetical protein
MPKRRTMGQSGNGMNKNADARTITATIQWKNQPLAFTCTTRTWKKSSYDVNI